MSERETDESLPPGQIFFDNKWARAATAVLGLSTPFIPACAPQPAAIVKPASASELGAETIEIAAVPLLKATKETIPSPDYQINLPLGWTRVVSGAYGPNNVYLYGEDSQPSIIAQVSLGQTQSPEAEARRIRQSLSLENVEILHEDNYSIDYLVKNVRILHKYDRDGKGQVMIVAIHISENSTANQSIALEFLKAIN